MKARWQRYTWPCYSQNPNVKNDNTRWLNSLSLPGDFTQLSPHWVSFVIAQVLQEVLLGLDELIFTFVVSYPNLRGANECGLPEFKLSKSAITFAPLRTIFFGEAVGQSPLPRLCFNTTEELEDIPSCEVWWFILLFNCLHVMWTQ